MDSESKAPAPNAPVLIVGGSLVGLSAAMFLGARGVPCVVVERHLGSSPHPRAIGFTQRTLEMFDTAGLRAMPEAPPSFRLRRVRVQSLAGRWLDETDFTPKSAGVEPPPEDAAAPSPHRGAAIAQDRLEPMLRERARELGATLDLGTELVRFEQDPDGVTAWLRNRAGSERPLRASYLIACDGNQSAVRDALGIERRGIGVLQIMRSVLFRADLARYQRGASQFEIKEPDFEAFLTTYGDGRWVLMFKDDVERDEATLAQAITRAIGSAEPFEIITTGRWELTALIADRFAKGRVFLAGDAAHTLPPTRGGYGANTGIADAYNLAWKLGAVLAGQSEPALLDSYDEERRPVAWLRLRQTFARPDYVAFADEVSRNTKILDPTAIELGELYRSKIVVGASDDLPAARHPAAWRGQPGTRAPHRELTHQRQRASTLDFFGQGWVLVSGDPAWCAAANAVPGALSVPVSALDLESALGAAERALVAHDLGIGARGASLVRPDGVVAWRSTESAPSVAVLVEALREAACAQPVNDSRHAVRD
jgi:2-polyprenyl-6-methoxyphenol hydroxylase-like FAD-dependent oxidoreductase